MGQTSRSAPDLQVRPAKTSATPLDFAASRNSPPQPAAKDSRGGVQEKSPASHARNALFRLHDELLERNPSAAASLTEGLEETLTVLDLRLAPKLHRSLTCTNGIESGFSMVDKICRQVKRWQGRDHRLR